MLDQIVILKRDTLLEFWRDPPKSFLSGKTGALHVIGCRPQSPVVKPAFAGAGQRLPVNVGAQDGYGPSAELAGHLTLQQDGQRIRLGSIGATRAPDAQRLAGLLQQDEVGKHYVSQR